MIHFHGTPCGGKRDDVVRFLAGRHALVPWVRDEDLPAAAEVCQSFCLDNGAFTAWKSGKPITDWHGYYDWVGEWMNHPGFAFAIIPDVIDGDESDNDQLLRHWPWGIHVGCPVWHLHESLDRLRWMAHAYPRVCLGSSGQWAVPGTDGWWDRMAQAMDAICSNGRPPCKLHGLRMLDPAIFHRLPLASADSTNAVRNSNRMMNRRNTCYPTASRSASMTWIADRIEVHQSASVWVPRAEQKVLCFDDEPLFAS